MSLVMIFSLFFLAGLIFLGGTVMTAYGLIKSQKKTWIIGGTTSAVAILFGIYLGIYSVYRAGDYALRNADQLVDEGKKTLIAGSRKGAEFLGEAFGEFVIGFSSGIDDKLAKVKIFPQKKLREQGLNLQRADRGNEDSLNENTITIYTLFEKDYRGKLLLRAFDGQGKEIGRHAQLIEGRPAENKYIRFVLDKNADLDVNSYCTLEEI